MLSVRGSAAGRTDNRRARPRTVLCSPLCVYDGVQQQHRIRPDLNRQRVRRLRQGGLAENQRSGLELPCQRRLPDVLVSPSRVRVHLKREIHERRRRVHSCVSERDQSEDVYRGTYVSPVSAMCIGKGDPIRRRTGGEKFHDSLACRTRTGEVELRGNGLVYKARVIAVNVGYGKGV